ncbi:MAG: DUF3857 domain-containing protein [Candidatus Hydrogenedentota bacterium]
MKRTRYMVPLILAAVMMAPAAADTLYLRDGEQHPGALKEMTEDTVRFETPEAVLELPKSEVLKIQLQRARKYDDIETVDQITDPDLKACLENLPGRDEFPAAGYVTLLHRQTIDLRENGMMKETMRHIALILQQRGEDVATANVWYFEDTDEPRVDFALTVTPDGRVLHLSDAALKSESLYSRLPEYQRIARLRFACKEPRPGSVIDMQYTVERKRGGPLEPVYDVTVFRGQEPIQRKEVVVLTPEGEKRKVASELYKPGTVEEKPGDYGYSWQLTQTQPGLPSEPFMPPLPHIGPTLTVAEAATWQELSEAYGQALAKLPPLSDTLAARATELAEAGGAEAVRNFVARNIRSVGVPQWHFRIVPHDANETAQRGVANELDKNFLYWRMLEAAGIEAGFALVRSRGAGPWPENTPSLHLFDRSAVYLPAMKGFTSAQSDVLSFDTLPAALQGVRAIVCDGEKHKLIQTQQPKPTEEQDSTQFRAQLNAGGSIALSVTYTAAGNAQANLRGLKDLDEQKLRNRLTQFAAFLHPSASLEDYEISELADLTVPPKLTLHCRIPDYAVTAGEDLMMFTLPAVSYSAHQVGRPSREFGLFWDRVTMETTEGTIALPDEYEVYSLPADTTFDSDVAEYRASLSTKDGTVVFKDAYTLKTAAARASAYPDYKKCLETRAGRARQRIILRKK